MTKAFKQRLPACKFAKKISKQPCRVYVIEDRRENKIFVETPACGIIRNFESIIAIYENGEEIKN